VAYFLLLYHEKSEKSMNFIPAFQIFLYKIATVFLVNMNKSTGRNDFIRCFCEISFLNISL